jgi:hypothetical protein
VAGILITGPSTYNESAAAAVGLAGRTRILTDGLSPCAGCAAPLHPAGWPYEPSVDEQPHELVPGGLAS